jgi:hypothetical protein
MQRILAKSARSLVCVLTLGALLALLLGGCSAPGRNYVKSELVETLELEIRPDTSKMFTYRLAWPEDQIPSTVRLARDGSGGGYKRGGVDIGSGTYARLQENAAYAVEHAGYCREGFFELDKRVSRYQLWIRGECKEAANAADQERFGTTKQLTPAAWTASS